MEKSDKISHGDIVVQSFWKEIKETKNVQVMYLTAMSSENSGNTKDIIEAVKYAEKNGATICNLSSISFKNSKELDKEISSSNMQFVVPAGNYGMKLDDNFKCYPASYRYRNVITVGALDDKGKILDSSNYGDEYVNIFYNGIATFEKQRYEGTSIACARITALLANNDTAT